MNNCTIGDYTYIAGKQDPKKGIEYVKIISYPTDDHGRPKSSFNVGKFCSIGKNLTVYLGGNHHTKSITTYPFGFIFNKTFKCRNYEKPYTDHSTSNGDIIVKNDVWIADNVTIMSGVTIESGAIVANNSHVVKDVKPYEVVGGNPARHINFRFNNETIAKLLKLKWWDLPIERIKNISKYLCTPYNDEQYLKIIECLEEHEYKI